MSLPCQREERIRCKEREKWVRDKQKKENYREKWIVKEKYVGEGKRENKREREREISNVIRYREKRMIEDISEEECMRGREWEWERERER